MGRPSTKHAIVAVAMLEKFASSFGECFSTLLLPPSWFQKIVRREIHAFSDTSKDAIGASIYLRRFNNRGDICTALLFGQSKVAPAQTTSIPRLELCAAVLTSQAVNKIVQDIDMEINEITFFTDSKIVLGYLQNESRRFYVYVANRVQTIRKISSPKQWKYVSTSENPADLSTRCLNAESLTGLDWLTGPSFLRASFCKYRESRDSFKIFNFFIFCPNRPFSELFSKTQLKYPNAL